MKVKKFRIRPRFSSVGRILKSIMSVKQLPPDVEASLPDECEKFLAHLVPTAFYQTWGRDEVPAAFRAALDAAGFSRAVAVTATLATIGSSAEEYLSGLLMNTETQRSQVVTAFSEESADLSLHFLLRLLSDEAKGDDCEVSEPIPVVTQPLMEETLSLLEADQEGVALDAAGHLSPRFTRVALVAWWPLAKKKRLTLAPKKKSA